MPHRYGEVHFRFDAVKLKLHALELRTDVAHDFPAKVMDAYSPTGEYAEEKEDQPHKKNQHVNYILLPSKHASRGMPSTV